MKKTKVPYMSDDEIRARYRDARDRARQVTILAECNAVSERVICDILGIDKSAYDSEPAPPLSRIAQYDEICAAWRAGKSYGAISRDLEIPYHTVYYIISKCVFGRKKIRKKSRA